MFGTKLQLTPGDVRKQQLLVESELNRARLLDDLRDLKQELHVLEDQLQAVGSVATSAAKVAGTVSAIGDIFTRRDPDQPSNPSWFSNVIRNVRLGASLWQTFRSKQK